MRGWQLILLAVAAAPGQASANPAPMSVRQLVEIAASTPRNPLSLMRPSVRRAWSTMENSIGAARAEEARARTAGLAPPFCIPSKTNVSPDDFIARMRAVPPAQQDQSVNHAVRIWMVQRFPCG